MNPNDPNVTTVLTRSFTGKLARSVRNAFIDAMAPYDKEVASYPLQLQITEPIRTESKRQGSRAFLPLWAGQGVGRTRRIDAAELIRRLREEVDECLARIAGLNPQPRPAQDYPNPTSP